MIDSVAGGTLLVALGLAHLLYTYCAYPWLVSLLPTRLPRPGSGATPRLVSVVIAARAAGQDLARKVSGLLQSIELPCEIVVALDGPDPEAAAALAALRDDRVKVGVLHERQGKAAALNCAVAMAAGDVLVLTDVRQRVAPGAVERLVYALASPDVGAISGSLEVAPSAVAGGFWGRYWRFERWLRMREAAWDSAVGVTGALYALKRDLWQPLPRGLLLDDVWVPLRVVRAGQRVGFDPRALVTDVAYGSDATELARKVRTLTGNYQLIAWMPSLLHPGTNRIWWQFVSHKVARLLTPLSVCSIAAGTLLLAGRGAALLATLGALALCLVYVGQPASATTVPGFGLLRTGRSGLTLLAALVLAAVNAARGRWDVWSDPVHRTVGTRQPE